MRRNDLSRRSIRGKAGRVVGDSNNQLARVLSRLSGESARPADRLAPTVVGIGQFHGQSNGEKPALAVESAKCVVVEKINCSRGILDDAIDILRRQSTIIGSTRRSCRSEIRFFLFFFSFRDSRFPLSAFDGVARLYRCNYNTISG